jgi:hypothetical protein
LSEGPPYAPNATNGSGGVFGRRGHGFATWADRKATFDRRLPGMADWRLHDVRRSAGLAKLGINLPVIEKVLGHTSGSFAGIVGVYQHLDFADEKR